MGTYTEQQKKESYVSSNFTVMNEGSSQYWGGRKIKSIRCPGKSIPADDLFSAFGSGSTGIPPSRVITWSVSLAKPRVIPVSELDYSQFSHQPCSCAIVIAYPVFTTLTRYELCPSRIKETLSSVVPIQSTGRAGTALEQSNRPAPLINSESGTGWLVLN